LHCLRKLGKEDPPVCLDLGDDVVQDFSIAGCGAKVELLDIATGAIETIPMRVTVSGIVTDDRIDAVIDLRLVLNGEANDRPRSARMRTRIRLRAPSSGSRATT
jgi:hypothetical protein